MTPENLIEMTEEELLARLHEEGFTSITLRNIEERRRAGLLPPFDTPGKGLGTGLGRELSTWGNGEFVVYQARCVEKLLSAHRSYQRAYIPLQMLRLLIPRERVKEALEAIVTTEFIDLIENPAASDTVEDLLSDEITKATKKLKKTLKKKNLKQIDAPAGLFEFIGNLFFNKDKGWLREDSIDTDAKDGIIEWQKNLSKIIPSLGPVDISKEMECFINNADFFHDNFSIPALREALRKARDEHFRAVERDLQILGEMGQIIIEFLQRNPTHELKINPDFLYEVLFAGGTYFALFNLSLRHRGYGAHLDESFGKMIKDFGEWYKVASSSEFPLVQFHLAAKFAEGLFRQIISDLGGEEALPPTSER